MHLSANGADCTQDGIGHGCEALGIVSTPIEIGSPIVGQVAKIVAIALSSAWSVRGMRNSVRAE
jgi:hypothetical protein